ncbi:MAG: hypothetical protein Q4E47_00545 [Candidatus Saccharibacteria bacterium]|nr:hypothetical protein [Candidatus Saccharibacteria bacterium]
MGRDITWPAGNWNEVYSRTEAKLTHECYESYRGYQSNERQLGKRFVVDADGKIKKGFNKWTMTEGEAYAPTDYATHKTVILESGDFIITSLRSARDNNARVELLIYEVTDDSPEGLKPNGALKRVYKLKIETDDFWSKIPKSEWTHKIPEVLHLAVKKAFKIPKRVLKSED